MTENLFKTGIRPLVDEYIQKKREEKRDYGDYWSASSAGYCMRKNIFERLGVPHSTADEARLQRVFESGHIFHSWMQGITKDSGMSVAQEVELIDDKLMVKGHFDDLVLVDGNLILYDYKTVSSMSFKYSVGRPISHFHKMQLGTYMYMLRKDGGNSFFSKDTETKNVYIDQKDGTIHPAPITELSEARILKISKDDLRMHEDQLIWSEALEKEVVGYWKTINGYWESKKLPKCTCADFEGGFMSKERYNPFYYQDEPCSLAWYELCKKEGKLK